ncbi:beta-N-acetylhexosaminidase [uncultured Bacteroides sp.]|uniref:beta-N-acetylhexosaminidase n=2 Tax=Bacteroides TaxID=816 RepID=UPI002590470F|nr:beta-N-acetylhexosaminidase [uncultured Bacteroides sp.]
MRIPYIFIFLLIANVFLFPIKAADNIRFIPQPAEILMQSGTFRLDGSATISFSKELNKEVSLLKNYLHELGLTAALSMDKSDAMIQLQLSETVLPAHKEGYILQISNRNIQIKSSSATGIFYGIQTLRQLVEKYPNRILPQLTITDYPAFSWRALMLDEARYFKGKEVVCRLLDQMAYLKMNTFHWHLTDDQGWRIEIKKFPKLTEIGSHRASSEINHFGSDVFDSKPHSGYYTQKEIKEIIEYAYERHINIIPEIEMPGHASAAIASYPWLGTKNTPISVPGKFGVHYNVYNIADPKVVNALKDILSEVIELFPSPVIHIGGDEVKYNHWKESSVIQAYMQKYALQTPAELQVHFTNGISNWLSSKGKRMMGWNEITGNKLHEYQSSTDTAVQNEKLAKNAIVHCWKGDYSLIKETIEKGYDIVNAYHEYTYLDYSYKKIPLKKAYQFNPIPEGLTSEQRNHVLGISCQMWGEFTPTVESMNRLLFPRIAAYAETGWCQEKNKNYQMFSKALENDKKLQIK